LNKFTERKACEEDREFILNLLERKLSPYHLHEKKKDRFRVRDASDKTYTEEYIRLDVSEVEIDAVRIVTLNESQAGAYKLDRTSQDMFYRLYWMASTGAAQGVGSYIIEQARKCGREQGINSRAPLLIKDFQPIFSGVNFSRNGW